MSIHAFAQQGAADFEEAYGKDAIGGGLRPNARLRAPTPDDAERAARAALTGRRRGRR